MTESDLQNKIGIGYVRVSTKNQADRGSHRRQIMQIKDWEKKNQTALEEIYVDAGAHGWDMKREEYLKMLEHLKSVDYLVIQHTDRFSRGDPLDTMVIYRDILTHSGKQIFSIMEGEIRWDTLEDGLIMAVKTYVHAKAIETQRKKIKEGMARTTKTLGRPKKELDLKIWKDMKDAPNMTMGMMARLQGMDKSTMIRKLKEEDLYEYPPDNKIPPTVRDVVNQRKKEMSNGTLE